MSRDIPFHSPPRSRLLPLSPVPDDLPYATGQGLIILKRTDQMTPVHTVPVLWPTGTPLNFVSHSPKRRRSTVGVAVLLSSPVNPFHLTITLDLKIRPISLSTLVDSGSEENLIDEVLVQRLGVYLISLPQLINVVNQGGNTFTKITHCTSPIHVICTGNYHESILFAIIRYPQSPVVLGFPWLSLHNSHMDWARSEVLS